MTETDNLLLWATFIGTCAAIFWIQRWMTRGVVRFAFELGVVYFATRITMGIAS